MKINLSKLKEKAEKATPGPWEYGFLWSSRNKIDVHVTSGGPDLEKTEDRSFISSANPDTVLKLLRALELTTKALDQIGRGPEGATVSDTITTQKTLTQLSELVTWGNE